MIFCSSFVCYFRSSDEVLHILGNILAALQRGRTSLVIPKKKPIDELMKSRNMVRFSFSVATQLHFRGFCYKSVNHL